MFSHLPTALKYNLVDSNVSKMSRHLSVIFVEFETA